MQTFSKSPESEPSIDITSKYNYMFFQFYCLNHLLIHQPLAKQPHAAI